MKTIESYDQIPYESFAIPETHPDALAPLARLLGIPAADPERCRVLELGAASGGNLIPMAVHLPASQFVGVELSAAQAGRGQALIRALGLTNIQLIHQDILDVDTEQARFDYILVHGVYSWVPEPVKEHILWLCGRLLAPQGIVYLSYNTLPGWRQRDMVRDMLLHQCRDAHAPTERLGRARELIERLHRALDGDTRPESEPLRRELAYLRTARASYLYHEYLEETNSPELFSQVMARAQRHGLAYLAETKLHSMFAATLGPAAEAALAPIETRIEREQLLDFMSLRAFRQTLLIRAEATPCLEINLDHLRDFGLHADLVPLEDTRLDRVAPGRYAATDGARFQVEHPLTKAILERLGAIYPNARRLDALLPEAMAEVRDAGGDTHAEQVDACLAELFNLYVSQGIGLTLRRAHWPTAIGERPRASALARAQAAAGEGHVASVRHRGLGLDPLATRLLMLLDGQRDRERLLADIMDAIRADPALDAGLASDQDAETGHAPGPAIDTETFATLAPASLDRLLALLARAGLLVTDPSPALPPTTIH